MRAARHQIEHPAPCWQAVEILGAMGGHGRETRRCDVRAQESCKKRCREFFSRAVSGALGLAALCMVASCGGEVEVDEPIEETDIALHLDDWHPMGPIIIKDGQTWTGPGPVQGRMNVVVTNPLNASDVWVGTAGGGVWRGLISWVDATAWTPITDDAPSLSVGAIAIDPNTCDINQCNVIWVGTGENSKRRDTQYGRGVLKVTWNTAQQKYVWTSVGPIDPFGNRIFSRGSITSIVLDPNTQEPNKRVFVALAKGVTANGTHATVTTTPSEPLGIWKSDNGGQNWVNVANFGGAPATDLEIDPLNGTPPVTYTLYAAFGDLGNGGPKEGNVQRSTNGGQSWQSLKEPGPGTLLPNTETSNTVWPELAVFPRSSGTTVVYAALDAGLCPHPHAYGVDACSPGIYRSVNSGSTWAEREPPKTVPDGLPQNKGPLAAYAAYTHALAVHPTNPDTIWYGGLRLYRSTNGGDTWPAVTDPDNPPTGKGVHPDVHGLFVKNGSCPNPFPSCPSTGICAFLVTDGGLYVGDGENCWNGWYQVGLEATQYQSVSVRRGVWNSFVLIGGTQDNGTNAFTTGGVWDHWLHGDASFTHIESGDELIPFIHDSGYGDITQSNKGPRRCWAPVCAQHSYTAVKQGIDLTKPYLFFPPVEAVAAQGGGDDTMFLGAFHLYKSAYGLSSWTDITPGLNIPTGTFGDINIQNSNVVTAIAVAPSDPNRAYLGYYDGALFTAPDAMQANPMWDQIDDGTILPDRPITSIAVHPTLPGRAFVSFSGFGAHSVYVTTTAGNDWSSMDESTGGNLAPRPVNALVVVPQIPPLMFAGTDEGVYRRATADPGDTPLWTKSTSLPHAAVYDFAVDATSGDVYAATHGRGVWRLSASHTTALSNGFKALGAWSSSSSGFFGHGFLPFQSCQVTLVSTGGGSCVTSATDADGATLNTNRWGRLVATKTDTYTERGMGWACLNGSCAGGVPASSCPLGEVRLTCGNRTGVWTVPAVAEYTNPPSSLLAFGFAFTGGATSGTFTFRPTLQRADGTNQQLCSVAVPFSSTNTVRQVLDNAAASVNANATCIAAGVTAGVLGTSAAGPGEDESPEAHRLYLSAPTRTGLQLLTVVDGSLHAELGLGAVGIPLRLPVTPRLSLTGTATGGSFTVSEPNVLGSCTVTVTTAVGESAATVRTRIRDAFNSPVNPSDACFVRLNPRDALLGGDGVLRFPSADGITVRNTDGGLSYTLNGDA